MIAASSCRPPEMWVLDALNANIVNEYSCDSAVQHSCIVPYEEVQRDSFKC